jgi:hypothetical protein
MATSMLPGASSQRMPRIAAEERQIGHPMAVKWNTPTLAAMSAIQVQKWPSYIAASTVMPLLTKPLNNGRAEIEAAPTMQKPAVHGIDL